MESLAIIAAAGSTRAYAQSALPGAPVEPPDVPHPSHHRPVRRATASALHHLADLLEPNVAAAVR
jgi:hypothetical protein